MKKIYLLATAAIISTTAFSQVKIGAQVTGSLNTASLKTEYADMLKKSLAPGFGIGVVAEGSFSDQLSLRTSLSLLQKGSKMKASFDLGGGPDVFSTELTAVNNLYYAELPVVLTYNVDMQSGQLFIGAGPSIGFGLFGKSKVTSINPFDPSEKETQTVDAFKKEDDGGGGFKRFDFSANAIAGFKWNSGLYINAGYLMGLSNLIDGAEGDSYKNRGLQLSIGYFLRK